MEQVVKSFKKHWKNLQVGIIYVLPARHFDCQLLRNQHQIGKNETIKTKPIQFFYWAM